MMDIVDFALVLAILVTLGDIHHTEKHIEAELALIVQNTGHHE